MNEIEVGLIVGQGMSFILIFLILVRILFERARK